MKTIESILPAPSHPAGVLSDKSDIPLCRTAFFDIETTGLAPAASSVYLIGIMMYDTAQGCYRLTQWFADNYHSEKLLLAQLLSTLKNVDRLFHFNGKTFDIPYVLKKCKRYKIDVPSHCLKLFESAEGMESVDILLEIRAMKKLLGLTQCSQKSVEHWLGIHREDPFNGRELTLVYSEYMQKKIIGTPDSEKLLSALLLHNYDDIAVLPELCSILNYREYLADTGQDNPLLTEENLAAMTVSYAADRHLLTLTLPLPAFLPHEITLTGQYAPSAQECSIFPDIWQLTLTREKAHYQIPVFEGRLKYFLPDYTDYYYLPEEDTAIHKSVASFVDSRHRKKATASTCFNRREGLFLPQLYCRRSRKTDSPLPIFREEYKSFPAFYELPEDFPGNWKFWRDYLSAQMPGLIKI